MTPPVTGAGHLGALAARDALVMQWFGLPDYVYRKVLRRCRPVRAMGYADAVQEGYVALLKAAALWDPDRGPTFAAYAIRAIVNRLLDAAGRWAVQVPLNAARRGAPAARAERCIPRCRHFSALGRPGGRAFDPAAPSPPRDPIDADLEARLARALARLRSREAEVVARCIQGGKPLRTVAARWRTSKQFVAHVKRQALARLRRALGLED